VFRGYQLHQTHLMADALPHHDKPVRLFKKGDDIKFYGCVHEQPQQNDCNGDIWPVLDIADTLILHTGYLTEDVRRSKMVERNRSLLVRDQEVFPDRRLGMLLWVREFSQMGQMAEEQWGEHHPRAHQLYAKCIGIYEKHFADPDDKFHVLGRPFYQTALDRLPNTLEFEIALAGVVGHFPEGSRAKPERYRVRTLADLERLVLHKLGKIRQQQIPVVVDVEPIAQPTSDAPATMTAS
jgi:hypothetical protein